MQRTRDIDVLRVLAIRQQLSKISTSKYNTMLAVMGDDDRARGLFQYYGTHTGRWVRTFDTDAQPTENGRHRYTYSSFGGAKIGI